MNKRKWLLFLLALSLVLGASVGPALAYFTDSNTVMGGYVVSFKQDPEIKEIIEPGKKIVTITNKADATIPVYVRAMAFADSQHQNKLQYTPGANWVLESDGFYYYTPALAPGASTTQLTVEASVVLPADAEIGEQAKIVVVYESTPASSPSYRTAWGLGS